MHDLGMNCERFNYLLRHFNPIEIDSGGVQQEEDEEEDEHVHHEGVSEEDAMVMEPVHAHCY
eukprot:7674095-Ditylum_brightwellii.AAC.1